MKYGLIREMAHERHELPGCYWEPEPPENFPVEITSEDELKMEELPFR